jgi:hypothetical protein
LRLSFGHLPIAEAREGLARLGRALAIAVSPSRSEPVEGPSVSKSGSNA